MSKKIYVNGGILITTPYFKYAGGGAGFAIAPDGAEIVETNVMDENGSYLKISDECPQSIFNEYYAATFFTTGHKWANFFHKNYKDAHNEYLHRIEDIQEVLKIEGVNEKQQNIISRLLYISIVASLETFICDTVLTKITGDEDSFNKYFDSIHFSKERKDKMLKLKSCNIGKWEQSIIKNVMKTAYCNIDTIKTVYKDVFNVSINDVDGKMKEHFDVRNLLAHKNGRKQDDSYTCITQNELQILITDSDAIVRQILEKIKTL